MCIHRLGDGLVSTPGRVLLDSILARVKAVYPSGAVKPAAGQAP